MSTFDRKKHFDHIVLKYITLCTHAGEFDRTGKYLTSSPFLHMIDYFARENVTEDTP